MSESEFIALSKLCAEVVRKVLSAAIASPEALRMAWPDAAESFQVLDGVRDDIFEYWALEPRIPYVDVLKASAQVLDMEISSPEELQLALDSAIDQCS